MQMILITVVIVVAVIAGVVYWWMTIPAGENVIKIGYTAPFTGTAAEFGTNGWYGMEIALEEINKEGIMIGNKKYTIEIIRYDDRCEPTGGADNAHRLIVEDKVVAILGSHCSSVCMATLPIIQEHGIPTITIECAADALTRQGATYYFRMRPSMPLMAPSVAQVMVNKLGVKSVSYVSVNDDYGRSFVNAFKTALAEYGVTTKTEAYFERGTTDYMPYLTEIQANLPDAVMYVGVAVEGAMLLAQAHELGLTTKIKFIGSEEMAGTELVDLAGKEAAANSYAISLIIYPPDPLCPPGIVALANKVQSKYGVPLHYATVFAYDALHVLAEAIKNAQSTDPAKIRDALDAIEYPGLEGLIKFEDFEGYTNQGNFPIHIFMWTSEGTRSYVG
jgi:branched-chain amino acid transport system substrate-binding protein